jgi:adenosine deaminase
MMELGMRVTINSDDPAYFGGYLEENFTLVQRELSLGPDGLATLSRNAFEAAWLPRTVKDGYLARIEAVRTAALEPAE